MPRPELSLVIPVFNEEEDLPKVDMRLKELLARLGGDVEVVFVDDGSRDRTMDRLLALAGHDARYRAISLSRRFGRERAIAAGLDRARGRAVIVTDLELQPPEVFLETVDKWKAGYDVVFGKRRSSAGGSFGAGLVALLFAAFMPIEVPLESGDFRLLSRRVVATLRSLRETHQSPRALLAWAGFRQATVEFDRLAAEKTVGFSELLSRALEGIGAFSTRPLRLATWAGALLAFCGVAVGIVAVIVGVGLGSAFILLLFAIQFLLIGILGQYVGRIYEQVKRRPLYVVAQRIGFGSKKRAEKLATRDIEELPSFASVPRTPVGPPVLPQRASKPPSDVPPPPAAVVAAGAAAERAISQPRQRVASVTPPPPPERASVPPPPPPERPSVTPAPPPPTGSAKPPPLKLSSSLGSMPAAPTAPVVPERASTPPVPPRRPSFAGIPHPAAVPAPAPAPTPSTPPVLGASRMSRPPSLPKLPSAAPRPPSVSRMPAIPRPEGAPASTRTPSNVPPAVAPTDEKKG
jgi:glycosyltransferase involved in cell wall biosynthesis